LRAEIDKQAKLVPSVKINMVMFMLEMTAMSTNVQIKVPGRKIMVDHGKRSNLQDLKGVPILYDPEQILLIAQNYRQIEEIMPVI
jgi:hypothetical protein